MFRIHDDFVYVVRIVRVVVLDTWGFVYTELVVGLVYRLDDSLQQGYGLISLIRFIWLLRGGVHASKQI